MELSFHEVSNIFWGGFNARNTVACLDKAVDSIVDKARIKPNNTSTAQNSYL